MTFKPYDQIEGAEERKVVVTYKKTHRDNLPSEYQSLLKAAENACNRAYAPYSSSRVGAAVLLNNDRVVSGSNQENAAYPSGLCAELVALFSAHSDFPNATIRAMAITAKAPENKTLNHPVTQCGSCRQVMAEFELPDEQAMEVILSDGREEVWVLPSAKHLLPLTFEGEMLR